MGLNSQLPNEEDKVSVYSVVSASDFSILKDGVNSDRHSANFQAAQLILEDCRKNAIPDGARIRCDCNHQTIMTTRRVGGILFLQKLPETENHTASCSLLRTGSVNSNPRRIKRPCDENGELDLQGLPDFFKIADKQGVAKTRNKSGPSSSSSGNRRNKYTSYLKDMLALTFGAGKSSHNQKFRAVNGEISFDLSTIMPHLEAKLGRASRDLILNKDGDLRSFIQGLDDLTDDEDMPKRSLALFIGVVDRIHGRTLAKHYSDGDFNLSVLESIELNHSLRHKKHHYGPYIVALILQLMPDGKFCPVYAYANEVISNRLPILISSRAVPYLQIIKEVVGNRALEVKFKNSTFKSTSNPHGTSDNSAESVANSGRDEQVRPARKLEMVIDGFGAPEADSLLVYAYESKAAFDAGEGGQHFKMGSGDRSREMYLSYYPNISIRRSRSLKKILMKVADKASGFKEDLFS